MKNKILVIEDDRAISELLCMNLTIAGYETVATYDGIEAQRLLLWNEDAARGRTGSAETDTIADRIRRFFYENG